MAIRDFSSTNEQTCFIFPSFVILTLLLIKVDVLFFLNFSKIVFLGNKDAADANQAAGVRRLLIKNGLTYIHSE